MLSPGERRQLPTVLVLASGPGSRYRASGGSTHKLQADLGGRTVLERTLDAVRASGLDWHLEDAGHPGMGDSIAAAVRHTRQAPGWLVLPGDLPLVLPATLLALARLRTAAQVVIPFCGDQRGHPVRFDAACGEALCALQGAQGAAAVIRQFDALYWPVADTGCITDIDTVEDLERARRLLAQMAPAAK